MQCPTVSCNDGKVSGCTTYLKSRESKPVFCYRNIPYAKPPIGALRFMPPRMIDPWEGIRDGTILGKIPMQDLASVKAEEPYFPQKRYVEEDDMNEDCLHLTVYTTRENEKKKMPVMVWIYGGSFEDGCERLYDGSALAGMYDVVVVIPNYRLNVFGFLSLGRDSECSGNAGLMDQNMALKWVQRNVGAFGGDPGNVTIFGESAGAMSVNHHVNSPQARGLIHRAISHSGQSNAPEFFNVDVSAPLNAFLKELQIDETGSMKILEKLQSIPARKLMKANNTMYQKAEWRTKFVPCVDGDFLTKNPKQSLCDRDFATVPYIIGINNCEGYGGIPMCTFGADFETGITAEQFKQGSLIPVNDEDIKEWKDFYAKDQEDDKSLSKLYCYVTTDSAFVTPAATTASIMSELNDVYFYHCCYQLRLSHDENFGPVEGMKVPWCYCDHGDDVYMMMGVPFTAGDLRLGGKFSREEEKLSITCMTYITNFAKHGDPNQGRPVQHRWPKYNSDRKHLTLDHELSVESNLAAERVDYWRNYSQKI